MGNMFSSNVDPRVGQLRMPNQGANDCDESTLQKYYQGKRVVVVGGTRGVGYGTALAMAKYGASQVTIVGRSTSSGEKASKAIQDQVVEQPTNKTIIDYVQGDVGTIQGALDLVQKLKDKTSYDVLVMTAAIFPDWEAESLLQEDGIDQCFAIAVMGRYILMKNAYKFMNKGNNDDCRILNVLDAGQASSSRIFNNILDHDMVTGRRQVTNLVQSLRFWSLANHIMIQGLLVKNDDVNSNKFLSNQVTILSTHPGLIKTDLHRGQGIIFDWIESIGCFLMGVSEEGAGLKQATIVASANPNVKDDVTTLGPVLYVNENMRGIRRPAPLKDQTDEHQDWLLQFLEDKIQASIQNNCSQ